MERDQKKKRARREEDFYYNDIQQPTEKQDTVHYSNSVRGKSEDSSSKDDSDCYMASENHMALGVFDFPWMREGIVSKSEDWDYLEDTFSSSLEDTYFRSGIKFYEYLYETNPANALTNFDEEKRVFNESDDGHGHGQELEMDCIWGALLNQPLQQEKAS